MSSEVAQNDSAEITIKDLNKAYSLLQQKITDQLAFNKWFGAYMTLPKNPDLFCELDEVPKYLELQAALTANRTLMEINSASRMAYANLFATADPALFCGWPCLRIVTFQS